jgi:hypothetical protein
MDPRFSQDWSAGREVKSVTNVEEYGSCKIRRAARSGRATTPLPLCHGCHLAGPREYTRALSSFERSNVYVLVLEGPLTLLTSHTLLLLLPR